MEQEKAKSLLRTDGRNKLLHKNAGARRRIYCRATVQHALNTAPRLTIPIDDVEIAFSFSDSWACSVPGSFHLNGRVGGEAAVV